MLRRSIAPLAAATLLASLAVPALAQDKFIYGVPSAISSAIFSITRALFSWYGISVKMMLWRLVRASVSMW